MRSPRNILIVPYLRAESSEYYCIFKRKDMDIWQFVSGGAEDDESPEQAAKREFFEETGISSIAVRPLKTHGSVPAKCFSREAQTIRGPETIVIPVYCFAAEVSHPKIRISDEHTEY